MIDYILEIAVDDDAASEIVESRLFLTASDGSVAADGVIRAYFASAEERDEAIASFSDFKTRSVDEERKDWLALYEQSLEPLYIGSSFIVAPDASLIPDDSDRHTLVIPQEQAFGTGSHESTALCIELLETLDLAGKKGLDIGAGSGILALAMRRLGADHVIAFDNDLDAYAALRENMQRNDVDRMAIFIGALDALRGGTFDVITMNILPDVIVPLLPKVRKHMAGMLVVSGILIERRDDVASKMRVVAERTKGEWWAAILSK